MLVPILFTCGLAAMAQATTTIAPTACSTVPPAVSLRALEVHAVSVLRQFVGESCGPEPMLMIIGRDSIWLGQERTPVERFSTGVDVLDALRRAAARQPDDLVLVQVDDDVSFDRVVKMVDALHGANMRDVVIVTGHSGRWFSPDVWRRPFRRGFPR